MFPPRSSQSWIVSARSRHSGLGRATPVDRERDRLRALLLRVVVEQALYRPKCSLNSEKDCLECPAGHLILRSRSYIAHLPDSPEPWYKPRGSAIGNDLRRNSRRLHNLSLLDTGRT